MNADAEHGRRSEVLFTRLAGARVALLRRVAAVLHSLFAAAAETAEMLSDAGHGPVPPPDEPSVLMENPYAGAFPHGDPRRS